MATTTLFDNITPSDGTPIENVLAGTGADICITTLCLNGACVSVQYTLNGTDWIELYGTTKSMAWSGEPVRPLSTNAKIRAVLTSSDPLARARVLAG